MIGLDGSMTGSVSHKQKCSFAYKILKEKNESKGSYRSGDVHVRASMIVELIIVIVE